MDTDETTSRMTGVPGGWKGFIQSEPSHHSALSLQAHSERTRPGTLSPKQSLSPVSALYMVSTMTWNYLFHIVVYLFIEYHTQNCYTTMRTLAPFFPHHVLGCVTQCLMGTGIPHSLVVLIKNSGRPWRYCAFSSRPDHRNKANTVIKWITWVSQHIWKLCLHYTVAY